MTLKEIVFDLWELYRKEIKDDDSVDFRQIAEWVNQNRAIWIGNELNKGRWDEAWVQDFGKIQIENVNTSGISSLPSKDYVKKTTTAVPRLIRVNDRTALTRVGPYDFMEHSYKIVPFPAFHSQGNLRYGNLFTYATWKDDYVYLRSSKNNLYFSALKYINIRGIVENPEDLADYSYADGTPCYTDDSNYPIDKKLYTYMREAIIKVNFPVLSQATEDEINDAKNEG